ncbi:MAG: LD-carboxypeptidase [Defluviitaleaceae bacterium]|nr:LD-carboxypeptidase [Defluviitaleaceae bacterium]
MIHPKPLKKGDTIGIVAPSGPIPDTKILKYCKKTIETIGFEPYFGKNISKNNEYLAGTDEERAEDINYMFKNKDISAIMCIRGGYGSIRILEKIDFDIIKQNPKIFIGYSDVTALHISINQIAGIITYHGPMIAVELLNNKLDKKTYKYIFNTLTGKTQNFFDDINAKVLIKGDFEGKLIGGNLSTIISTLGTPYEINTNGCVLFLEEVRESRYKIDRMLNHLKLAKKFENVSAVMLGHFSTENEQNIKVLDIFKNILEKMKIPCIYNIPAGHKLPNITLPLGTIVTNKKKENHE